MIQIERFTTTHRDRLPGNSELDIAIEVGPVDSYQAYRIGSLLRYHLGKIIVNVRAHTDEYRKPCGCFSNPNCGCVDASLIQDDSSHDPL